MIVCPTITVDEPEKYSSYLKTLTNFAQRIHLDCGDKEFTGRDLYPIQNLHWPESLVVDLHAMYEKPLNQIDTIISLNPNLVIVHAEAENIGLFIKEISQLPIKKGLAILQSTSPRQVIDYLDKIDHILVFSGKLGQWGGSADLGLTKKVKELRSMNPNLEISWDGGVNETNIRDISMSGVDVVNVGSYISCSDNPGQAYSNLIRAISK